MLKGHKRGIGLSYAIQGLKTVFQAERNFKIHLLAFVIVLVFGFIFTLSKVEWFMIMIVSSVILISETVNSVIELLIDYVNPKEHPTAKKIKDMSAAAVLIAAISAVVIGLLIFVPKVIKLF